MKTVISSPVPFGRVAGHIEKGKREDIEWKARNGGQTTHRRRVYVTVWRQYSHLAGSFRSLQVIGLMEKKKGHGGGIFVSQVAESFLRVGAKKLTKGGEGI